MTSIEVDKNVPVEMRDGVRLIADVYRPAGPGRHPVLLQRTPYGKMTANGALNVIRAAEEGYVVVVQDGRGRFLSEGEFTPFVQDINDGYDSVEWCAAAPWSNGRVGMFGMSYVGATQWLAAISAPPNLQAIFPVMTAADYYDGWIYQGGAMYLSFTAAWAALNLALTHLDRMGLTADEKHAEEAKLQGAVERLKRTLSHVPMSDLPLLKREGLAPYYYEWLRHPDRDALWKQVGITGHHNRVTVPAYNVGGWFDLFVAGPLRNFAGMRENGANVTARRGQKLLVGPWTHSPTTITVAGERGFGYQASVVLEDIQLRWFDHWLRDRDTGLLDEPPARIFVMGEGWRDEHEWPLARTEYTPFFLHSDGRAQSLEGDGKLSALSPGAERPDQFLYNPLNPVGTVGPAGVFDQRPAERRTDVLVYTSAPLAKPVEVTGPVKMVLYASSSAPDTDFTAKLVDVLPNGYARNVCDGILRARYRDSQEAPSLLDPGKVYELHVDMLVTSNLFEAGHQVRVEVSSSNFPKYDRNPNTGRPIADEREFVSALQTVYHDAEHPSHVLLPVIPR